MAADQTDPVPANNATSVNVTVNNLAPVLSNEITPQASTNSITITWTTDHPATSRVIYDTSSHAVLGAAPNYGYPNSTVEDSTLVLNHSVTITGLIAGTTYFFRPVSHGSPEAVGGEVNSATSASGGSGGSGGGSFGSVSSTVSSGNTTTTPVAISPFQGLAFDQNAANNEQGQVLGASTNVPSGDPNTLPKTGVPPEGLVLLILAAATVGVVRYKYYQI